jgi:hypothetical protein
VAEHGVIDAGMLHGGIHFALDAGDGLQQELAEVAKGFGGLLGDSLFGQGGEDLCRGRGLCPDGVEFAGKGGELGGWCFEFETLLLFAGVVDAEGGPFLRSMRQVLPSENWRRHLFPLGLLESEFIGNLKKKDLPRRQELRHRAHKEAEGRILSVGNASGVCSVPGAKLYE